MSKKTFILLFKKRKITDNLTILFTNNAATFNGLYNGIYRIATEQNKKNFKPLDEFYQRMCYLTEYSDLAKQLSPFFPTSVQSEKQLLSFCKILLSSMKSACIFHTEKSDTVILTKDNVMHYEDWDGNELYVDDTVKIISPAWYQEGHILEKGYCTKNAE